jgi:hypothetical protein
MGVMADRIPLNGKMVTVDSELKVWFTLCKFNSLG